VGVKLLSDAKSEVETGFPKLFPLVRLQVDLFPWLLNISFWAFRHHFQTAKKSES
jgi:hypothetical protein